MRVAFVYIDPSYRIMGPFHIGIASLIACLRQAGHECSFLHFLGDVTQHAYVDFLNRSRPDVVAFSVVTNTFPHLARLASLAKSCSQALTVCGGVHATLSPDEVIAVEDIDAICLGEGEDAIVDLCDALEGSRDIAEIPNLWVKKDGQVRRNPLRPLVADLDALPFPDRRVFPYERSFDLGFMKRSVFMASRGCPYNCNYCCNHALKELYGGDGYVRLRSVDSLIEEVEAVTRDFPQVEYNVFHDDLLPLNRQWFEEFTREYRNRVRLPFEMNCQPNLMTREIARMAGEAGCTLMRFGVESGNEHMRRQVLDRHVSTRRIIDAFSSCDEAGIQTLSYNMVGLPFETRGQVLDTIRLNGRVRPAVMQVSIFYPYRGTKLFEVCQREGLLSERHIDSYFDDTVLVQKALSPEQVRALRRLFEPLVRVYSRCYALPPLLRRVAEKAVDAGALLFTDRRVLRLWERMVGMQWERAGAGPCYTLEQGRVRVWGRRRRAGRPSGAGSSAASGRSA